MKDNPIFPRHTVKDDFFDTTAATEWKAAEFADLLMKWVASLPEDQRDSAVVDFGYGEAIEIYCMREETDAEYLDRYEDHRRRAREEKLEREARDRSEWARLKAKFGPAEREELERLERPITEVGGKP